MSVDGVSEIYCRGLDKAEKIKSIEGVTGFWLEEPTELKKEDFIQIDLRLRGKPQNYFQIIQSFNPVSKLHWIYDEFFARERDDARVDHSTYRDNAFLDDEYIRVLENLINEDETYYNIYTLGEWGEVRAIIYNNWVREQFEPFDKLKYEILTGGLDFGYNNPAALVLAGVRDNEIYYFAEVYKTHLTNTELIDLVADKFTELGLQTWDVPLWADHEMDRIEEFQKAGFTISPAEKAVPVKNQIDFLKRMREHVSENCPNLIREQQGYKWKEDLRTGLTLDEPVKFRDHAMDAKRYAVYSLYFTLTGEKRKPELVLGGKSFVKGLGEWQSDQRTRPQD
jgi:phage terminase large subunit